MGYAEEAKITLGKAKEGEASLELAQVYASLAVLEAIDELSSQVAYLSDTLERQQEK